MKNKKGQLIVALDVDTFEQARKLVDELSEVVDIFKVGSQLFTACGPVVVRHIIARGKKVFLDLKFHDIPNTVANAVSSATALSLLPHDAVDAKQKRVKEVGAVFLCTIHTLGGKEMMAAAKKAAVNKAKELKVVSPLILGITVLTSDSKTSNMQEVVLERARSAKEASLDGVVASSQEAMILRREFGEDFIIVTPGIRPAGKDVGDQKRVSTPAEAVKNGSNFLVVGRPIVEDKDPLQAAKNILKEINSV